MYAQPLWGGGEMRPICTGGRVGWGVQRLRALLRGLEEVPQAHDRAVLLLFVRNRLFSFWEGPASGTDGQQTAQRSGATRAGRFCAGGVRGTHGENGSGRAWGVGCGVCPLSTGARTRRVQLVQERGEGGGAVAFEEAGGPRG